MDTTSTQSFEGNRRGLLRPIRNVSQILDLWRTNRRVYPNVQLDQVLDAESSRFAEWPQGLDPTLRSAMERRGVSQLYTHQSVACEAAMRGEHVVVATPTASGKSVCFNLPVLDALAKNRSARALYLFPTKALSRDQEEALRKLMGEAGMSHGAITYDGDTPGDARKIAKERAGIMITNPDMLHAGILPHHAQWARLFADLKYVVIDELHTYRGVFGSHLSNLIRRLQRIAKFHGSNPQFIMASATIGNPQTHAESLIGAPVTLVEESGAPRGPRHVMVYNPPVVNAELGIRESALKSAVRLSAELVRNGVSTLVFGQSRNNVEVMLKYLRERLAKDKIPKEAIHAYRGGYLPQMRRDIEKRLRDGEIRAVVATNALELGIDVGALDAVVCVGYPGSVASLWQRFGRAGRRMESSLALLVTNSSPLDQFFAAQPDILLDAPSEEARIDPDNVEILIQHLKCAAFELPFEQGETFGTLEPDAVGEGLDFLAQHQVVHKVESNDEGKATYHWADDAYPANQVSLRSVGWDNYVIIDVETGRNIAEMDWRSTHTMLHEQAIYQHDGDQYQVEKLDYENHKAFVRKVIPDYFTDAMTYTRIAIIEEDDQHLGDRVEVAHGEVSLVDRVVGYKKIRYNTHENVGYGDVRLPDVQMHTTSVWWTFPNDLPDRLELSRPDCLDALRGLSKVMHTVATVGLMSDPRDLGFVVKDGPQEGDEPVTEGKEVMSPTIFMYDSMPGGVGLSSRVFDERQVLLPRAKFLLEQCVCQLGCPTCIGPVQPETMPGGELPVDRKKRVSEIIDWVLAAG